MSAVPAVPTIVIRPLRPSDLEGLLDLWEQLMRAGEQADPRYRPTADARWHMREHSRERWLQREPFPHTWVAEHDGALVGFTSGFGVRPIPVVEQARTALITDLFVAETHRRHGIARRLFEAFADGARAAGHTRIEVGTLANDARAVAFWRSVGFTDWKVTLLRE